MSTAAFSPRAILLGCALLLCAGLAPGQSSQLLATIPLTNGAIYLSSPAIDPNTERLYTAGGASFSAVPVQVIDLKTNTTVGTILAGSPNAGVRVNSANNTLDFGELSPSQILVYDISGSGAGTQLHTFGATGCAIEAFPDTGNNRIWGASQCGGGGGAGGDPIIVIDGNSNTVLAQNIGSGGVMGPLVVNAATHKAYIGPSGTSKEIDPNSFAVSNTPFSGTVFAVNSTTNRLYASTGTSVQVIDGSNDSIITTISGFNGISGFGIAVNAARNRFYVLDGGSTAAVDIYDGAGNTRLGAITLPSGTNSLAGIDVDPATGNVYVSDSVNSGPFNLLVYSDNFGLTASSTTLTAAPSSSTVGQNVTFTATVTGTGGTPTGKVTFSDGGTALGGAVTLSSGTAQFQTSSLAAGTHSITAAYSGDGNFQPSTSSALPYQVSSGQSASTTSVSSSANPSTYGGNVTFTATVSGSGGTPTGNVTFKDGSTTLGTGTLNGGAPDQATLASAALSGGSHSITAVYAGDKNFSGSTSAALSQAVNAAASSTTLTASPNPSVQGAAVTFTATVTGVNGAATPTGSVTFKDSGAAISGAVALNSSGVATFTTASLSASVHAITAAYAGDGNYQASNSAAVNQTVNQNTAIVATIPLSNGSIYLHAPAIDTNTNRIYLAGGASFDSVPVAVIDGNSNSVVATIGSGTAGAAVNSATNTLYFATLSPSQIFAYDVSGSDPKGTQTHSFSANGCAIEAFPDAGNNHIWGASQCGSGNDPVIVIDSSVNPPAVSQQAIGSGGVMGSLVVNSATHKAYIGPSNTSKEIDPTTFAVSNTPFSGPVQAVNAVSNRLYSLNNGTVQVINGANDAVITSFTPANVSAIAVNPTRNRLYVVDAVNSVVIVYNAASDAYVSLGSIPIPGYTSIGGMDVNSVTGLIYVSASKDGSNFSLLVINDGLGQTATSTAVTPVPNPSTLTQLVTFAATVSGSGGAPSGSVTFKDGASTLGTGTLNGANPDQATFATSALGVGSHSITAVYSGDSTFSGSTSSAITQTVGQATATVGTPTSTPNPSATGQSVTFTAVVSGVPGSAITPTGSVTFQDGGSSIGSGTLSPGTAPNATATLQFAFSAAGPHNITAVYGGDTNYAGATSQALAQTVNPSTFASQTVLGANPASATFGQPVMFTATVSCTGTCTSAPTPTGSVTFNDGATALGTQSLSSGAASFTTSALAIGSHSITAVYSGDGSYSANTSNVVTETISGSSQYLQATNYTIDTASATRAAIAAAVLPALANSIPGSAPLDLNGDGKTDIAVTTSACVSILTGAGNGAFATPTPVSYSGCSAPSWIAAGQFTAGGTSPSGHQDLAVANPGGTLDILPGNGNGSFGAVKKSALSGATQFVIGDFNGDGKLDVAAITGSTSVSVMLGNGDGAFGSVSTFAAGGTPVAITTADFDGDGRLDLVTINSDGNVAFLKGQGNGTFKSPAIYPQGVSNAASVTTADLNNDGSPDLIVTSTADYSVRVLLNNTDGTFQLPVSYAAGASTVDSLSRSVAIGDFDGDGNLDLAIPDGGNVSILFGNGNGTFQPPLSYAAHPLLSANSPQNGGASAVTAGDFSGAGSGKLSLAVANQLSNDLSILLGNGDGSFQGVAVYGTDNAPGAVAVGDLNGDGLQDQVIANRSGNNVTVLLRKPNGTFHTGINLSLSGDINNPASNPQGVALGSFRCATYPQCGGAALDIATVNNLSNNVSVLLNDGHAHFSFAPGSPISIGASQSPRSIRLEDFDGDGKLDIVVSNHSTNSLTVLFGNGDGTFNPPVTAARSPLGPPASASGGNAQISGFGAMITADFNNDGNKDIAVTDSSTSPGKVWVSLNQGKRKFSPLTSFAVGNNPVAIAAGDLRSKGVQDLVVANQNDQNLSILFNNTPTGGATPVFVSGGTVGPVGTNPSGVALLDLNGDGCLDIAVVNAGDSAVVTLLGNSNSGVCAGTFAAPVTYDIGLNPQSVAVGNFSGGGAVDLGAANNGANSVSVLLNKGATVMKLSSSANPAVTGSSITFTVNLNSGVKGLGVPTCGPSNPPCVTLSDNGAPLPGQTAGLTGGAATFNISNLPAGTHTITAFYSGDPNFLPRESAPLVEVIRSTGSQLPSSTSLQASSTSPSFGDKVTFTAQVSGAGGTPTGNLSFNDGSQSLGSAPLSNGSASLQISTLAVGAHSITAAYGGDANFGASASQPALAVNVARASTTSALPQIFPSPAQFGQQVTVTAQVSSASTPPTGTVTLTDGGTTLAAANLAASGQGGNSQATFNLESLAVATHPLALSYSGDSTFLPSSTPSPVNLVVSQAPSITSLSISPSFPPGAGTPVALTATVSSGSGSGRPSGTVTFTATGGMGFTAISCSPSNTPQPCPLNSAGQAMATATFANGSYTLNAAYNGDQDFKAGMSPNVNLNVLNDTTTTITKQSPSSTTAFNAPVTFTATVTSSSGTPNAGSVSFFSNGNLVCTASVSSGSAGCATPANAPLPAGSDTITATYNGDVGTNFAGSNSAGVTQTVTGVSFALGIAHQLATPSVTGSAAIGRPLSFRFTVTNNSGGSVQNVEFTAALAGPYDITVPIQTDTGSCPGPGPLTCSLGTMASGATAHITVTIVPLFSAHNLTATVNLNATTQPSSPPADVIQVRPRPFIN